jgi:hypothetical protein
MHEIITAGLCIPDPAECFRCHTFWSLMGTWWRSWLRRYSTSQKAADSIPDEVTGFLFFNWPYPTSPAVALEPTLPLTGIILGIKMAGNLTLICEPIVLKMWKPQCLSSLWASATCYRALSTLSECAHGENSCSPTALVTWPGCVSARGNCPLSERVLPSAEASQVPGRVPNLLRWCIYRSSFDVTSSCITPKHLLYVSALWNFGYDFSQSIFLNLAGSHPELFFIRCIVPAGCIFPWM